MKYSLAALVFSILVNQGVSAANAFDVRGNKLTKDFFVGAEMAGTAHSETGLDTSKGRYSTSDTTLGLSVVAQYHLTEYYFQSGIGLMYLMAQKINELSIDMTGRTQWHVPLYLHGYYKLHPYFAAGAGLTYLIETSLRVNGTSAPDTSYAHTFLDLAGQFTAPVNADLKLNLTVIVGLNLFPGRQNVYTVGDLLHVRFQLNVGLAYGIF